MYAKLVYGATRHRTQKRLDRSSIQQDLSHRIDSTAMDSAINAVTALQASTIAPPAPVDSPPKTAKRGRQKRSTVWQHFEEVEADRNTAICNHCSHAINRGRNARNTTNLHQHLRIRHPELNLAPLASFPRKRKSAPAATAGTSFAPQTSSYGGKSPVNSASSAVIPLARFIAEAGLPLSAVSGPALRRLAAAWGVHGPLPNMNNMRASGVPRAVAATQTALRTAIASSAVSIVVGDVVNGVRIVWCNALSARFDRSTHVLAVFQEGERDAGLLLPRDRVPSGFGPVPWNVDRLSPMLKGRISTLIAKYGILERLQSVVIPEHSGQFEVLTFSAPREEQQQQQQQQESESIFHRHPVQEFLDAGARGPHEHNGGGPEAISSDSVPGIGSSRTIPVVPCLASFVENIVDVEVLSNPWIENSIMMPVRFALRPNSPRRGVKKEKKAKRTFEEMGTTNQSFDNDGSVIGVCRKDGDPSTDDSHSKLVKAKEMLDNFLKRFGNMGTGRAMENIDQNAVTELRDTLRVFEEACVLLTSGPKPQDGSSVDPNACSPVSVAIPVLRSVCRALDSNLKNSTGEFGEITKRLLASVSRTQRDLETQEMYACATLLDPRFKARCFSSDDTGRFAETVVLSSCRQLERARENDPDSTGQAGFGASGAPKRTEGSVLGQFMDEVVQDRLDSSTSVSVYLAEPAFSFSEDVVKYWQRNAARWPDLTAVAAKYLSVPASASRSNAGGDLLAKAQFEPQDRGNMLFLRLNSKLDV